MAIHFYKVVGPFGYRIYVHSLFLPELRLVCPTRQNDYTNMLAHLYTARNNCAAGVQCMLLFTLSLQESSTVADTEGMYSSESQWIVERYYYVSTAPLYLRCPLYSLKCIA